MLFSKDAGLPQHVETTIIRTSQSHDKHSEAQSLRIASNKCRLRKLPCITDVANDEADVIQDEQDDAFSVDVESQMGWRTVPQ